MERSPSKIQIQKNVRLIACTVVLIFGPPLLLKVVETGRRSRMDPLHLAAADGNVAECERLVKSGYPVDATDNSGDTALNWAVYSRRIDVVRKLLDLGAEINHRSKPWRLTPLMYTATPFRGHLVEGPQGERNEVARVLIERGADVNLAADDGSTALHFAATDRNARLARMLLGAGARRDAKTAQGYTPMDLARFPDYAPNDDVIAALQPTAAGQGKSGISGMSP